jgi:hypothetical protein
VAGSRPGHFFLLKGENDRVGTGDSPRPRSAVPAGLCLTAHFSLQAPRSPDVPIRERRLAALVPCLHGSTGYALDP